MRRVRGVVVVVLIAEQWEASEFIRE